MSLVQPLCAKRTISKLKQIVQDASSSVKCLPGWRFPTSLDHNKLLPAFKVTRRLSSATAQAPRDTVCCDPAAFVLEVNLSTCLQSPWLLEKKRKSPSLGVFLFLSSHLLRPKCQLLPTKDKSQTQRTAERQGGHRPCAQECQMCHGPIISWK